MKKQYETILEIFNNCSGNQMRDVFFDEVETEDPDAYVRERFKNCAILKETDAASDTVHIYEINENGLRRRITLTEI